MRAQRRCIEPDCSSLHRNPGPRCGPHEREYQRVRNRDPKRKAIRTRQWQELPRGGVCWICGRPGADTLDHVQPRLLGGTNDPANLRPAHRACNAKRGAKSSNG